MMAPHLLAAAKNWQLHHLLGVRRRIANLKAIRDPGLRELNTVSAALRRLVEAWQK